MSDLPTTRNSRRRFLTTAGGGAGAIALAAMAAGQNVRAGSRRGPNPLAPRKPHFQPRVKRVLWLFMHGGPSHVDLFDPKPELRRLAGEPLPASLGEVMTRRDVAKNPLLGPVKPFRRHGQSGLEISDFFPHLSRYADDLCVIRSMHGDSVNHPQSVYQMNTGSILMGKPSVGSWVAYGLGSENQNMPAFVVLPEPGGGIKGGPPAWGSGFLPATFQGTLIRSGPAPILHLRPAPQIDLAQQRRALSLINDLNRHHRQQRGGDDELDARIMAYELAFRMQSAAPELVDLSRETRETKQLYGMDDQGCREFGTRCLLARRMLESGVRFVQLYSGDTGGWDAHNGVLKNHTTYCRRTDKPIAGLLCDLKRRGMLEDTLVIWGGEFGRMPMSEKGTGRDHNPWGYSVWLAGGGVRGGMSHGATDAIGLRAAENKVHVRNLHATILYLLGINHQKLNFFHNGLDERLTGPTEVEIVREILA